MYVSPYVYIYRYLWVRRAVCLGARVEAGGGAPGEDGCR